MTCPVARWIALVVVSLATPISATAQDLQVSANDAGGEPLAASARRAREPIEVGLPPMRAVTVEPRPVAEVAGGYEFLRHADVGLRFPFTEDNFPLGEIGRAHV